MWIKKFKEFVNHKILDCIGDLYTCGYRMVAGLKCSQEVIILQINY